MNIVDALSRMNQCNSKDLISEKEDIVRFVAMEANPVALTTRENANWNLTQSCRVFSITLRKVTGPNVS